MITTGAQLASAALDVAKKYKTLYVMGCFGAPLNTSNKSRYIRSSSYNRRPNRTEKIQNASFDTFGFDCVCLIKGLLWGWSGNVNSSYGGATYASNGVPDYDANSMINVCKDVSTDFRSIVPGCVVWMPDHIGIYIGSGEVVECTPAWDDGVQISKLKNIVGNYAGKCRSWVKHGKLPYIQYENTPDTKPEEKEEDDDMAYSLDYFIRDIQNIGGVSVDGDAGSNTIGATVTISKNTNSDHMMVLPIQKRLKELGFYQGYLDGLAGDCFDEAVIAYQKVNNCHPDGEITAGDQTWKKLLGM